MTYDFAYALDGLRKAISNRDDFFNERIETRFYGSYVSHHNKMFVPARMEIRFDKRHIVSVLYECNEWKCVTVRVSGFDANNGYHRVIQAQVRAAVEEIREAT